MRPSIFQISSKSERWLKQTLAEVTPGQYLNHMLKLETSENKEQVMRESHQRLLLINSKAEQFLSTYQFGNIKISGSSLPI